ncbi:MAG: hypothetical protein KC996_02800 [Phycisphaerales bacterium]|nr:hypothetical protein [Phycisphaerales bacterium]
MTESNSTNIGWDWLADSEGQQGGGVMVLEPTTIGAGSPGGWSDHPIAGREDDLDEDERYFLDDDEDENGDTDSDLDSDYDDDYEDEDDEGIDADLDSDDDDF